MLGRLLTYLTRLIERLRRNMASIIVSIGVLFTTLGFTGSYIFDSTTQPILKVVSVVLAIIGVAMFLLALQKAHNDEKREIRKAVLNIHSDTEMLMAIKAMAESINNLNQNINRLIDEIRRDRNEHRNSKNRDS